MKGIIFLSLTLLLGACSRTEVIDYQQVLVAPQPSYQPFTIVDDEPVDVTMTSIDYY